MNRREATLALLALGIVTSGVRAQQAGKPYRIGFLGLSSPTDYAPYLKAFQDGLREQGYEEGRNIVIDYRWAEGSEERLAELAHQLVRSRPDVLVSHATGVRAVQQATSTIPIVMGVSADPVGLGLIQSLAKPGGNTTGVASLMVDLASKRLELLKEIVPNLRDVAVLSHEAIPGHRKGLAETETTARKLGVRVRAFWTTADPTVLDAVLAEVLRSRPHGLIVQPDPLTGRYSAHIAALAVKNGVPAMGGARQFAADGGLVVYGADFLEGWRIAARYVDRILKGAKPGDLPVEQPTTFEFVINLRTARALGLAIPPALELRASEVIR
jgi:putative ABC transport system substrate-binding protein